jgi:hypothetical protein
MKFLKKLFVALLVFIVLLLVVAFFIPANYTVSVSQTINQPKAVVYDYVKILKNQEKYSVWVMEDKNIQLEYFGTDGTIGAVSKWNSKIDNVGEGQQTITIMNPDKIEYALQFIRPMEGKAKSDYVFKSISDSQTELTTNFYGESGPYPFNLISYAMGSYFIKKAETDNLANIKAILEKK